MTAPKVLINGKFLDASSAVLEIDGTEYAFKEVSYKDGLKPGSPDGSGAQRAGRTRGKYEAEASLTLYKRHCDDLVKALGDGYFEKEFLLTVSYRDDDGLGVITDELVSCRITEIDESISGADGVEAKLAIDVMYLKRDGKKPLLNMVE